MRRHNWPMFQACRTVSQTAASLLKAFRPDNRGGVAVIFGLSSIVLFGLAGGGIDYARLSYRRAQLQTATDVGTLTGGNMLKLAQTTTDTQSVSGVTTQAIRDNAKPVAGVPFTVQVRVSDDGTSVTAQTQEIFPLPFGRIIGVPSATITVSAQSKLVGKTRLCVLALDPTSNGTLTAQDQASVTASQCSVYSDSASTSGVTLQNQATILATSICSAGGNSVSTSNPPQPGPKSGCPSLKDPLAVIAPPTSSGCTYTNTVVTTSQTLYPGTYCNGLKITKGATATLSPGVYVIDTGPLTVDANATLTGSYVGIYLKSQQTTLNLTAASTINLTAPRDGPMSGLLFYEDPTAPLLREHKISSNGARQLLGTIYMPRGKLTVDSHGAVADQSAYTVIVSRQLKVASSANLTMNAMYSASDVPVPSGVGNISGRLLLAQ
ncbi:TadE/TadG family type IV pilus assembly protein [Methylobacterium sp. J-070]|uniref:TadE/TadG family type IV pilus assembly protein n=1 Tax=Methylobacterium sp. J-070 TaxID=2836650 RepID=UPI001FB99F12|nr:TadE/TadG family type IV pilus assembly protein [Methylobacterium sp. J-070]MCJ2049654.1 pilus assembly protein [Methylobacterium sp. J-070]